MRTLLALILTTLIYSAISLGDESQVALLQVNVVVPDRSSAALSSALQTAFERQMIQMSGNPNIMISPRIQNAAKNVKQWIETYGYVEQQDFPASLVLQVTFDQSGLQKLIDDEKGVAKNPSIENNHSLVNQQSIEVVMTHVQDMQDLSNVLNALHGMDGVKQVSTKDLQNNRATISIAFSGDLSQFENKITQDNRFKISSTPLVYEWVGIS